jgi:hypothetical protein
MDGGWLYDTIGSEKNFSPPFLHTLSCLLLHLSKDGFISLGVVG